MHKKVFCESIRRKMHKKDGRGMEYVYPVKERNRETRQYGFCMLMKNDTGYAKDNRYFHTCEELLEAIETLKRRVRAEVLEGTPRGNPGVYFHDEGEKLVDGRWVPLEPKAA